MKTKLEEAAKEYWEANKYKSNYPHCPYSFLDGAKWQAKKMYSEEEVGELVYTIIGQYAHRYNIMIDGTVLNDLFEKYKKK